MADPNQISELMEGAVDDLKLEVLMCVTQQCPDKVAWPTAELGPPPPLYFDAGMFVHEPSMATAKALLDTLRVTPPTPFAEQDFLNMFFRDQYKPIPLVYNLVPAMLWWHPENVQLDKVKVVHYRAPESKPWRYTGKEANMDREDIKMLVKKWWAIYNDESLDFSKSKLPPFGSSLRARALTSVRQNVPAVATLAASWAAAGVVASAANPAICFAFYAIFIVSIAVVMIALRDN
ncbi:hypothetical protein ACP70R_002958 [Stipagrostis hirtigluma subsp. patula]